MKLYYQDRGQRRFLSSLLNMIFILLASFLVFFASFYPIGESLNKAEEIQMNKDTDTLIDMAKDSKLLHTFDNGKSYNIYNTYEFYIRTLLKYDYEHSDYNLEEDVEKYKEKQDEFKSFIDITTSENTVNDDLIGDFYTQYMPNKLNSENQPIIDYKGLTYKNYFYYEILDIDGVGNEFFLDSVDGNYPHLKDSVRKAIYNYNFLKNLQNDYYDTDTAFFNYFVKIFNNAGEQLKQYNDYGILLDSTNASFTKLLNYDFVAVFVSFFVSYLILMVIVPLLNKDKRNLAEIILARAYLREDELGHPYVSLPSFFIRSVYGLFKYFFIIFIFSMFININVAFGEIFSIGIFPVSIFLLSITSLFLNSISTCVSIVRLDKKNLENLISSTRVYTYEKSY